ncbi:MAG: hypothetical protein WCD89_22890 [Anaerocolumna sp.]
MIDEIKQYLDRIEQVDLKKELIINLQNNDKKLNQNIRSKKEEILMTEKDIKLLKSEIVNILRGKSKISEDILMEQIDESTKYLNKEKNELIELEGRLIKTKSEIKEYHREEKTVPVWKEEFDSLDTDVKKMLLTQLIDNIRVDKDEINVKLKITLDEFLQNMTSDNAISFPNV